MDRISRFAGKLGGKLGVAVCTLGFVVIFLGWNGAASFNDLRQQFPYLVSGGVAGLGLVVIGAALLLIEAMRTERGELQATLLELRAALETSAATTPVSALPALVAEGAVVAGASSYHRPTCRLVEGRDDLEVIAEAEATERGLAPCRICTPDVTPASNGTIRRRTRSA
jgi:hypothetical protein